MRNGRLTERHGAQRGAAKRSSSPVSLHSLSNATGPLSVPSCASARRRRRPAGRRTAPPPRRRWPPAAASTPNTASPPAPRWWPTASPCRRAAAARWSASPMWWPAASTRRARTRTTRPSGLASWYGPSFHGRLTANGEVFDRASITAAHPTMPLPSYVRVTNLHNGYSIIARVNDRGPYHGGRLIDVSERVAEALDFRRIGTARVKVDYVGRASTAGSDDEKLYATLRTDGAPAQLRGSATIVASAEPQAPRRRPRRSASQARCPAAARARAFSRRRSRLRARRRRVAPAPLRGSRRRRHRRHARARACRCRPTVPSISAPTGQAAPGSCARPRRQPRRSRCRSRAGRPISARRTGMFFAEAEPIGPLGVPQGRSARRA